ncbi:MAG TPA: PA14 domain-containing protein [Candidatus Polarisedimenticolia bacterium]|nr:PA14 domain-containing protein [Candidatus Polarisedimenticolia bacterium]
MSQAGTPRTGDPGRRAALVLLALAAVYVLLLVSLFRPSGGLLGTYQVTGQGGVQVPVHTRVDPRVDFSVPQRIDDAYIFHWDMQRHGFPAAMPPYVVRWTGLLRAPREGTYGFGVEVNGEAKLAIDDTPLEIQPGAIAERPLSAGWHPIAIDYTLTHEVDARLVLSWRPPGGSLRPIPTEALAPNLDATGRTTGRRALGWILLAAGAASVAGLLYASRREGAAARLVSLLRGQRVALALGAIVILGALVRFHDYDLVPFHHETADEYQHAWEGWTLLHDGVPKAWSTFPDRYPAAQTRDFRWFGDPYVLVWPYFDHPPLFSMIVGVVVSLAQPATYQPPWDFLSCTLPVMRVVPIVLSLAGILLLYRLAREYGATERAALLATLVYATLPLIVLAHRLVKAESLLSLLFMGAILCARGHDRTGRAGAALLAGTLAGLSIWCKATGIAVLVVILVLLLSRGRRRGALMAFAVAVVFILLYLLYAWAFDFGIFLKVLKAQSTTKLVSMEALQDILAGKIVTKYFGRGWYLWLLLCAAIAALRRERALLVPLAVYATMLAMTADSRVIYGWYRIPIYPFLCVAAGIVLEDMLEEADLYRVFPFAIAAVSTGVLYMTPEWMKQPEPAKILTILFGTLALGPYLIRLAVDRPLTARLARGATWALLALFFLTNLGAIDRLLEIYSATRGLR